MAINSYGYPNLIAAGADLSQYMSHGAGHRYSFMGHSDFRVTISGTGTRRVNIAAGWAMGKGVMVHNTASATLDLPAPSGSAQWFLVGLKRWTVDPAPGGTYLSELVYVAGTASKAVPAVDQIAGDDDTQWIALCQVTSGETAVQLVEDLRLVATEGSSSYVCYSSLAMDQLNDAVGSQIYRADLDTHYKRVSSTTGVLSWKNLKTEFDTYDTILTGTAASLGPGSGWNRQSTCRMVRKGKMRWGYFELERANNASTITSDTRGGGFVSQLVELHQADKPHYEVPLAGRITTAAGNNFHASATATAGASVNFFSMAPNLSAAPGALVIVSGFWWVP